MSNMSIKYFLKIFIISIIWWFHRMRTSLFCCTTTSFFCCVTTSFSVQLLDIFSPSFSSLLPADRRGSLPGGKAPGAPSENNSWQPKSFVVIFKQSQRRLNMKPLSEYQSIEEVIKDAAKEKILERVYKYFSKDLRINLLGERSLFTEDTLIDFLQSCPKASRAKIYHHFHGERNDIYTILQTLLNSGRITEEIEVRKGRGRRSRFYTLVESPDA